MSSPAPSSPGQEQVKKPFEQITFRFCSECSNMLYPREDDVNRQLMFVCRTCNYSEKAQTACIYRNVLNNAAGETAGVTQDVGSDPTVRVSSVCSGAPGCGNSGASVYVCCLTCGRMITCEICRENLAVLPASAAAAAQGIPHDATLQTSQFMALDQEDVDIYPIEEDSADLAATLANTTTDYFGELMEEDEEEAMGFEPENTTMSHYALLPRSKRNCPVCNHGECVYFQSQQRTSETGMKLFYVCCDCGEIFQ
ncbi:hypothetical protein QBC38DRAFT_425084 [Podospora fimiseda]|uniref:DNA-directed RNA polymerase II subunit RPB9 n=1 Tax=Podospora fimiseda TaxID=252190 RepID=A0AAN7BHL1_9PEZI|nr:hypothetical protein QBC38DRAFT_425084 [Podospora fimiseda]